MRNTISKLATIALLTIGLGGCAAHPDTAKLALCTAELREAERVQALQSWEKLSDSLAEITTEMEADEIEMENVRLRIESIRKHWDSIMEIEADKSDMDK